MTRSLGHYRIEEQLGAGGMGVVYRATDSKLGRQVAIKVLPEKFAHDPERLARFEREARLLAALNHPNIAAIHGLEEAGGMHYLVLEYVPGETLKGPLPPDQSLPIARQIAEALEAAHEKGIVHRDLKPANIKITPEGKVKVLDFGLAKAVQGDSSASVDLSQSPTVSAGTEAGVVMGTAGYMSPEQARGAQVDKRADIWAFGCVLYEILAGRRAFAGETLSDCVAAVLAKEPDWERLPASTPRHIRTLLRRCLQKDPQKRLRDIGDARLEVEEAPAEVTAPHPAPRLLPYAAAWLIAGAGVAGLIGWRIWRQPAEPPRVTRFTIPLPAGEVVPSTSSSLGISPDGTRVALVGGSGRLGSQVYLRELDDFEVKPAPGTAMGTGPFFSPDGRWLGFRHLPSLTLKKVALTGGAPVTMGPVDMFGGATWESDDSVLLSPEYPGALYRQPAKGGTLQPVTKLDPKKEDFLHYWPQLLPGGKAVLFSCSRAGIESYDDARIEVQVLATGERRVLVDGGSFGRYSPTGHIVYGRTGTLLAVPFDVRRLAVTGPPAPVLDGVLMAVSTPVAHFALSGNGTLVYAPGKAVGGQRNVVWVDRQGKTERLTMPPRMYLHPRISPDSRQIAVEIEGPTHDLYTYDLARAVLTRVTLDGSNHWPVWTPDGKRIAFRIWRPDQKFTMWWMPADRSGAAERLTTIGMLQSPSDWTPDGKAVAFSQRSLGESGQDIYVLSVEDRERKPVPFSQTKFAEGSPKFSPDGRWIAYTSNESGRNEIYVQAYPGPGPKIQVSTDGGMDSVWKRNGGELYYRSGEKMMAVSVTTHPAFRASVPRLLWEGRYALGTSSSCGAPGPTSSNYDVTPDGQRFLMIQDTEREVYPREIHVVLNWTEELKKHTP